PVWFASGTACAFIFMRGWSVLPGIFLGSFCAYYLATNHFFQSSFNAGIDASQAFLLLWFSYRYISPTLVFYSTKKCIQFILCCSVLTAIASLMRGLFYDAVFADSILMFQFWLRLWLGNLTGILVFSLAILTWDLYFLQLDNFKKINKLLLIFCYGLLLITIIALLFSRTPFFILLFSLATMPIICCISLCFGWCGVSAAVFLFGLLLNFAGYLNLPVFATHHSLTMLIYIQAILVVETIVGLYVAIRRARDLGETTRDTKLTITPILVTLRIGIK
ncbi:MAG TPA: MASE1 domain-containing protein, partial [Gammaproteobacteria bacterium]|nr:MASE1 domain-containing protein [Gammaproteobacteria bacterium]